MLGTTGSTTKIKSPVNPFLEALLVKEYVVIPVTGAVANLSQYLEEHDVLGIEGLDTEP